MSEPISLADYWFDVPDDGQYHLVEWLFGADGSCRAWLDGKLVREG